MALKKHLFLYNCCKLAIYSILMFWQVLNKLPINLLSFVLGISGKLGGCKICCRVTSTVSANHFANFWALDKKPPSSKNKFFWLNKLISYERKFIFLSGEISLIRIGIIRRRQTACLSRHKKNHYSYIYAPIAFIFGTIKDFGKLHFISKRRLKIPKIVNFIW